MSRTQFIAIVKTECLAHAELYAAALGVSEVNIKEWTRVALLSA